MTNGQNYGCSLEQQKQIKIKVNAENLIVAEDWEKVDTTQIVASVHERPTARPLLTDVSENYLKKCHGLLEEGQILLQYTHYVEESLLADQNPYFIYSWRSTWIKCRSQLTVVLPRQSNLLVFTSSAFCFYLFQLPGSWSRNVKGPQTLC